MESNIRSKFKLQQNDLGLEFKENGKYIVLEEMEDLQDGMTIKVSISTQLQSNSSFSGSNLTITDSINVNNECWWNTKPNDKTKWEEKGFIETKYNRYLLRENKQK